MHTESNMIWEAYQEASEFDIQLKMGIGVEMEHTNDKSVAEKIARDHLAEDPKYYTKLKKANL